MSANQSSPPLQTSSPINQEKLESQNGRLLSYLQSGKVIDLTIAGPMGIKYLNSRISDLRNRNGIIIHD